MIVGAPLMGAGAALSWGLGDFTARFVGRAVGITAAMLGIMLVGSLIVGLYIVGTGEPLHWEPSGLWILALNGVATALATYMLFDALTRGPVSLGSPIVSSYPALALPMTVVFGARPDLIHWIAMAATVGGIWLVALAVSRVDAREKPEYEPAVLRRSILMALGSAVMFAVALLSADFGIDRYGLPQTLLTARVIGVVFFAGCFLFMRRTPGIPGKSWPLLALLAVLDTSGYVFVYGGLTLENGEYAIVTSSAYSVVTVILARIFLREPIAALQWLGVAIVAAGIATLSATG
jgi:drug/metabolite transporter (DMT)-like permease